MTAKRPGADLGLLAVVGLALCCGLPTLLAAVGDLGAGRLRGWLRAGAVLVLVAAAAVVVVRRIRCRRRANAVRVRDQEAPEGGMTATFGRLSLIGSNHSGRIRSGWVGGS